MSAAQKKASRFGLGVDDGGPGPVAHELLRRLAAAPLRDAAPGKTNLCLYLGPTRPDGRHELVSVMQSLTLADELTLEPRADGGDADEVVCPGVTGENLAGAALAAFRAATGWDAPPQRLTIAKHVPVAAGMGARAAAGFFHEQAARLG